MPGGFTAYPGSGAFPLSSIPVAEVAARKVPWVRLPPSFSLVLVYKRFVVFGLPGAAAQYAKNLGSRILHY
jgi:hypothetical protein